MASHTRGGERRITRSHGSVMFVTLPPRARRKPRNVTRDPKTAAAQNNTITAQQKEEPCKVAWVDVDALLVLPPSATGGTSWRAAIQSSRAPIRKLYVRQGEGVTAPMVAALASSLTFLQAARCTWMHAAVAACTLLEELRVPWCEGMTDATLAALPHLRILDCRGCGRLTDAGLQSVASSLTSLRIEDVPGVTDAGLAALCHLQALELGSGTAVGDAGLAALAPTLVSLGVHDTDAITDAGVRPLRFLQCVQLRGTRHVSAGAVAHIPHRDVWLPQAPRDVVGMPRFGTLPLLFS